MAKEDLEAERFAPHDGKYLVRQSEAEKVSRGGVHIPDAAAERPASGVIVASGGARHAENGTLHEQQCEVGDTAVYRRFAGSPIELGGEEFVVLTDADILGVITQGD